MINNLEMTINFQKHVRTSKLPGKFQSLLYKYG